MQELVRLGKEVDELKRRVDRWVEEFYWFHRLSPGEYYLETILDKIMRRKYVIEWTKKVAEPHLREGSIWYLPFGKDIGEVISEWSKGYVTFLCKHLGNSRTEYFLIITTNVIDAIMKKKPAAVWWMCPSCYRKIMRLMKQLEIEITVWDWEKGFKLKSRVEPVIIYSTRWWRKKILHKLVVVDPVAIDFLERAREVLREWIWWKTYSQGITKRLNVNERALLHLYIWEPEIESLIEQLKG